MNTSSILYTAAVLLAVGSAPLCAQEQSVSLSLQEALELSGRNSPELRIARSRLRSALGYARQGRAIPNPTASVTNEDLGEYSERYFNLSQRVDFVWEGGPRRRWAEARASEARAAFQVDSARIALDVKRAYVDAWQQARVVLALHEVDGVVAEVLDDARVRFAEGDLAGYDLRRLRVARASVGRRLIRADVALAGAERRLGSLVAGDASVPRVRPGAAVLDATALPFDLVAIDRALARRPELAVARSVTEALDAEASLARTSMLAGTAVTGGFKHQSDGRAGLFLGVQLPIPVLDRRSADVDAATAEVDRSESELDLLRLVVAREASLADSRLAGARRQQALLGDSGIEQAAQLLSIARVAYDEGEVGIVELVDAADTFLEARLLASSVHAELWIAFHELEHAIGGLPRG
ncbi:MAG: TolC family protein, partial [Deltaproteobacteria bacterium]|nr:TolC family protein [Deltaproteobacteria bacterium]